MTYSPPERGSFIRAVPDLRNAKRAARPADTAGTDTAFRARAATVFARAAARDRAGITCPPELIASGDAVRHSCGAIAASTAGACWHCGAPLETETEEGGTE